MEAGRNVRATRREMLAGLGALAVLPSVPAAAADLSLRAILDRASALGDPARMLALVQGAPRDRLNRADRILLRMVERGLERELDLRRGFPFGKADGSSPYVVSHRHGSYLQLEAGAASPSDTARRLDEETQRLRAEAGRGLAPPDFMLEAVLGAETALRSKASAEAGPALDRQMTELRRLRSGAGSAPGIWRLPGGPDYYRLRLACTSGLDDGPERIERRAAAETAALLENADRLLGQLGLGRGSVGERLRALKRREEFLYANDEAGRSRAVAGMNNALARYRRDMALAFNPPLALGSSVRRMAPADEAAGRRGYRDPPTPAGAGAYYPDLATVRERPSWTLTPVAFHETIPGHLHQLERQQRADPHPLQLRYAPGYPEGWAMYAESLAGEMDWPIADRLGFLQSRLFRLARVTCDIGIHLRRWDRARAIAYLEETVGFELFFPFAAEVDRYAAEPGAFAGDLMVAQHLSRLGDAARRRGPAALRQYHDAVLNRGPVSAETLARLI
ncbi:MAG: hypothetical protein QOJ91_2375 [Sphingomonadales bacterium]|jgi:uncharacterized protein (DUF885 family)|nr:hypothetical protein [Sphingomonadales bacterium]